MDALHERMESDLDVITGGPWMLCTNGWSLIWTISWLAHGVLCANRMESDLDVIMVGPWMLCENRMESDLDVILVGTWMLCVNG